MSNKESGVSSPVKKCKANYSSKHRKHQVKSSANLLKQKPSPLKKKSQKPSTSMDKIPKINALSRRMAECQMEGTERPVTHINSPELKFALNSSPKPQHLRIKNSLKRLDSSLPLSFDVSFSPHNSLISVSPKKKKETRPASQTTDSSFFAPLKKKMDKQHKQHKQEAQELSSLPVSKAQLGYSVGMNLGNFIKKAKPLVNYKKLLEKDKI